MGLAAYLQELRSLPPEKPIEPELKGQRVDHDKRLREEIDLQGGAVLQGVIDEGEGEERPQMGDLVYVHFNVRDAGGEALLFSTRASEGGSGQPLAVRLGKGLRPPRAWEIILTSMRRGGQTACKVKPEYGYRHPDCRLQPPNPAVVAAAGGLLHFELHLLNWYPDREVFHYGEEGGVIKRCLQEGEGWETPRPPFDVAFHVSLRTPSYNGRQLEGCEYYNSRDDRPGGSPLEVQLGRGLLPPGIEEALSTMAKQESAVFVVPAGQAAAASQAASKVEEKGGGGGKAANGAAAAAASGTALLPAPPGGSGGGGSAAAGLQVEAELELLSFVQVRDLTGTGQAIKRRLREGRGEFPLDCPLEDTTVRIHMRARQAAAAAVPPGSSDSRPWAYDSRAASGGEPLSVDTGCGDLPDAVESAIKVMLPGEVAAVVAQPALAYGGRPDDCPPGLDAHAPVEFELELEGFDKEAHWSAAPPGERLRLAEGLKAKGNALFRAKKFKYAQARYTHLVRLLDATRDVDSEEQGAAVAALKAAACSNLALVCINTGQPHDAVRWASRALELEPTNAKALFRRGKALTAAGDYDEAEDDLRAALALEGDAIAADVEAALAANKARRKAAEAKQKSEFKNMFGRS